MANQYQVIDETNWKTGRSLRGFQKQHRTRILRNL